MEFLKEFFQKVDFEKISRRQKSMKNYPECNELRSKTTSIQSIPVLFAPYESGVCFHSKEENPMLGTIISHLGLFIDVIGFQFQTLLIFQLGNCNVFCGPFPLNIDDSAGDYLLLQLFIDFLYSFSFTGINVLCF